MKLEQEKIAQAIQIDRERLGYTQEDLAKKVGYSQQAIAKWEAGSIPRHHAREKLIRVLGRDSEFARLAGSIEILSPVAIKDATQQELLENVLLALRQTGDINKYLQEQLNRYKEKYGEL